MQKFFRIFSQKVSKNMVMLLISAISLSGVFTANNYVSAAVNITPATGGENISLDTSSVSTTGGSFTALSPLTITESVAGEIGVGGYTFSLPSGWEFDTSSAITMSANWDESEFMVSNPWTFYPGPKGFLFNVIGNSTIIPVHITFSGLKVRPVGDTPTNSLKITLTSGSMPGITNGTGDGITGTSFGVLSTVAGSAKKIVISNPTDATVGNTVNVTIEIQDQFGNKVASANDQAITITVDGSAKISGVTTGAGDGTYNSNSEVITSNSGQIILTITDATAETVNITTNHATLDYSSAQNVVFAAASTPPVTPPVTPSAPSGSGSGSGSSETTGFIYPLPTGAGIQTTNKKIISSSSDGTKMESDFMTVSDQGKIVEVRVQTSINPASPLQDGQVINLETRAVSEVKSLSLYLPSDCLQNIGLSSSGYANKVISSIVAREAAEEQVSAEARGSMYLFGYKKFVISLNAKNNNLTTLEKPIKLSFDVSNIEYPAETSIAWYDKTNKKWVNLGDVLNGNILSVDTTKLGDFGVVRTLEQLRKVENIKAGRPEVLGVKVDNGQIVGQEKVSQKLTEAEILAKGDAHALVVSVLAKRFFAKENSAYQKYVLPLVKKVVGVAQATKYALTNFIAYGSESAIKLTAAERASVLTSYQAAFGKLPITARDWQDVINIATGHWTSERNTSAENKAKTTFRAIYRREADLTNKYDEAAINILAYGLLPAERNLASERVAIKTFKGVFKKNPTTAVEWNTVRAIAYSGAKR